MKKDYQHKLGNRPCEKCGKVVSPLGGRLRMGRLVTCAACRLPPLAQAQEFIRRIGQ